MRTQGGTPWAVQLGEWSRRFYLGQPEQLGIDSGFTPQGYVLPCFTEADVTAARERMDMQSSLGLDVRWLEPDEVDRLNPTLAPGLTLGGTYCDAGRLPQPAAQRDRLRGGAGHQRRQRPGAHGLHRPDRPRRPGHRRADQPGPDRGRRSSC